MEQEFKAVIEKNSSAQADGILKEILHYDHVVRKERLKKSFDEAALRIKQLEDQLTNLNKVVTELDTKIAKYKKFNEPQTTE